MKKIISMMLAVVMIVACMATVAFAAEPETVTVTFEINEKIAFAALGAYLDYDAEALTLVAIEPGKVLTDNGGFASANKDTGKVGYANNANIDGEGTLVTATFELTNVEAGKTYEVELVIEYLRSAANENVDFAGKIDTVAEIVIEEPECEHKNVEIIPGKAATCTETGLTEGKVCKDCGVVLVAQEVIPALGHKWGEWEVTKPATCHEEGVETRVCKNDPAHKETRAIEKLKHVPGEPVKENIVEATQTTDGSYDLVVYCVLCGDELSREHVIVPALGLDDEPNTGDFTPVLAMFAIVVMMVPALLVKKFRAVK